MKSDIEKPVFIIGNPRSGTTLLRLMLTAHPDVLIPPEAGFAMWLQPQYGLWNAESDQQFLQQFLDDLFDTSKFENWGLVRDELQSWLESSYPESYADAIAAIYRFYMHAHKPQASIWGDKNNFYLNRIPKIRSLFPQARFIHIVRDVRNVAVSYQELSRKQIKSKYAPSLPVQAGEIAREWQGNIDTIRAAFDAFSYDNVLELRLEDLTVRPAEELRRVCDFLGIDFSESMLEYYKLGVEAGREPDEFMQWKAKNMQPVIADENEKYRSSLSAEEISTIETVAGCALRTYGYL